MSTKASKKWVIKQLEKVGFKHYVLLIWLFMSISYLFFMVWANYTVGYGSKLWDLQAREKQLKLNNQLLENEIASRSALRHIEVKAQEMGFKVPEKIWYIPMKVEEI